MGAVPIFSLEMEMTSNTAHSKSWRLSMTSLADDAYASYDFGHEVNVLEHSGWEYTTPGHLWSRRVYVETGPEDDGVPTGAILYFSVRFDPADNSVAEAYALDSRGQYWGSQSKSTALPQDLPDAHATALRGEGHARAGAAGKH